MNKILILGENARETILASKLLNERNQVYVMSENANLGIIKNKNIKYYKEKFDIKTIAQISPDYIFAFNEKYVFDNSINRAIHKLDKNICVCIPNNASVFLEKDKFKVRKAIGINKNDEIVKISNAVQIRELLHKYGKLFIRVTKNKNTQFCILENNVNNLSTDYKNSEILAEPYIDGKNVTITYFIRNGNFSILPIVFDYPYFINQNKFVKTSGVMCEYDYEKVIQYKLIDIAYELVHYIKKIIPQTYCGFLATQILLTKQGYKFIEFDVKPGEPEFINIVNAIRTNFNEILNNKKDIFVPNVKANYSLSVTLANEKYPAKEKLQLNNLTELFENNQIQFYYSKAMLNDGKIQNFDGGRLGFLFKEGKREKEVFEYMNKLKKETKEKMRNDCGSIFLIDRTTKELL